MRSLAVAFLVSCAAASAITNRLEDPQAIYVDAPGADAAATLQSAIDKAAQTGRQGIVFLAEGRYEISRTVYVWPGVRIFGYGQKRPILALPPHTPGFGSGLGAMILFAGRRLAENRTKVPVPPQGTIPPNNQIADANSDTFYSALSGVDFEVREGNERAVCVRFHIAQHAFLSHIDFHLGSALAGVYQVGNEAEDLHFFGGRYGILTEKTSPAWQFTLLDSTFEGQSEAAIREHEAGLTLIHDRFTKSPIGVKIDDGYPDQLWVEQCTFEHISDAALIIGDEKTHLTEVGVVNSSFSNTPTFAVLHPRGKKIPGKGSIYKVEDFTYGVIVPADGNPGEVHSDLRATALNQLPVHDSPAIRKLPESTEWVNVHTLGVVGDGKTDDTAAIQRAIDTHSVLYFPSGHYLVTDTLRLRPDTVLIGLHVTQTQFDLPDNTPAFAGIGAPKPVIFVPEGGHNILAGFGVSSGGVNPRAVSIMWCGAEDSLMDDVRILGGHGSGMIPYNNTHTADPDLRKRWDGQYPSIWVTHNGGGTFADIWTPDTFAQAGFYVSDTKTPGHVYELSNEHHVRNEIKLDRVENWDFAAPQTEEEAGESPDSLSFEIEHSRHVRIANYHAYRVTRSRAPFPSAVRVYGSSDIDFRNVHVNAESGYAFCDEEGCGTFLRASKYPYENAIQDVTSGIEVRDREFARFDVAGEARFSPPRKTEVRRLAGGFFSVSGAAVSNDGTLYFVDHHEQRIYRWSSKDGLRMERDSPLDPVNLAFDQSGNLIVFSSAGANGTVYTFRPGSNLDAITVLPLQEAKPHPSARAILPQNYWHNGEFRDQLDLTTLQFKTLAQMFAEDVTIPKAKEYVSPDGSVFIPAGRTVRQGPVDSPDGWRFSDNIDTHGFVSAQPGSRVYVSSESEDITYSATVNPDGALRDLKPFAYRGGESVATDRTGRVYVANGQIFVYGKDGVQVNRIDVPERPIDLAISDGTLYILTHHTLYSIPIH